MTDDNELRGLIYTKYKSKAALAKELNWSHQRLSKALKHPEKQPLENIQLIIEALGLQDDFKSLRIFLPEATTQG